MTADGRTQYTFHMNINYNKVIDPIVSGFLGAKVVKATYYIKPNFIVRATRKLYSKRIQGNHNIEITLTVGKPNCRERDFIKDCKKAQEPFPVKKIQCKLYNPPKKKLK